ncbi:DUF6552 family protein [Pseudomonas sp. SJZ079]|uniref:DUF6552 family protein n=1 Tax=Pseudomonas sp. SJZ079 TaxID=2572887 RepID=UPI00353229EE
MHVALRKVVGLGYPNTESFGDGFRLGPPSVYRLCAGLVGWLLVGVFWSDRAGMFIREGALAAMLLGLAVGAPRVVIGKSSCPPFTEQDHRRCANA